MLLERKLLRFSPGFCSLSWLKRVILILDKKPTVVDNWSFSTWWCCILLNGPEALVASYSRTVSSMKGTKHQLTETLDIITEETSYITFSMQRFWNYIECEFIFGENFYNMKYILFSSFFLSAFSIDFLFCFIQPIWSLNISSLIVYWNFLFNAYDITLAYKPG